MEKKFFNVVMLLLASVLLLIVPTSCSDDDDGRVTVPLPSGSGNNDASDDDNENGEVEYGEMSDSRDGKTYQTVVIGDQEWMAENLFYAPSSGEYWAYNNNGANARIYGYLYNWETAKNACPSGWHLPSIDEWDILIDHLGGAEVAAAKMKSTSDLWDAPDTNTTNSSGFSGLPGGMRVYVNGMGVYGGLESEAYFWTASDNSPKNALTRILTGSRSSVIGTGFDKKNGMSVRCLKD